MEQHLSLIEKSPLFRGVAKGDVLPLLQDLKVRQKNYKKGEFLFYSGEPVTYIGLVLEGSVHIIQEDYWGNRNILSQIPQGFFFRRGLRLSSRGSGDGRRRGLSRCRHSSDLCAGRPSWRPYVDAGRGPVYREYTGAHGREESTAYRKNALPDPALDAAEDHALLVEPGAE